MSHKPVIALTQGDPAGIGPELCLQAATHHDVLACCRPVIVGDLTVLVEVASSLNLRVPSVVVRPECLDAIGSLAPDDSALVMDCGCLSGGVEPGTAAAEGGMASYRYLEVAIRGACDGVFDALTTGPINKKTLHLAGIQDVGHTEILGRLTGTKDYAMLLYSPKLAVSFVTCHQSLRSVPESLTIGRVRCVVGLLAGALERLKGRTPHIAVLGLNPHAGEDGLFGDEDTRIIKPAIEQCRSAGMRVEGPIPPDTAFSPAALKRYDGHVAMYHDQGHIPFKMVSFQDGVNVTLGLPIVRTSVDHGTAYDIAWQGKAEVSSLIEAIKLAAGLASGSQRSLAGG